jgi:hypothetical protein
VKKLAPARLLCLVLVLSGCPNQVDPPSDAGMTAVDSGSVDSGPPPDSGPPADSGSTMACTPSAADCAGDVARVCSSTGDAYHEITCSNGCTDGACDPLSLETGWRVHQFMLLNDSITTPANYVFEEGGLVAVQTANPLASVYLNDTALPESVVVTGRFSVQTSSDDDLIGFVFGWQDPEHFYLVDWKQTQQNDGSCGLAEEGAVLKVVSSTVTIEDCTDLWRSSGTARVTPLVPVSANPAGWDDFAEYDLRLVFRPGAIEVQISQGSTIAVSMTSNDTTYRSGKFGFFNYSQEAVRYEFFSISPVD